MVIVEVPVRCCRMMWLPRRRTSTNPCCARIRQASRPDITRSLPNLDLEPRNEDLVLQTALYFGRIRALEEQLEGFDEIAPRLLDRVTLARDVQLGTEGDVSIPFPFDDPGERPALVHGNLLIL